MRARIAVLFLAVVAGACALTTSADAHPAPFIVKAGNAAVGTRVAASIATAATVSVRDTTSNQTITCAGGIALPTVLTVSNSSSGARIGTIDGSKVRFDKCNTFSGIKYAITGYGTWYLNVSDSTNGVSAVTISNLRAHLEFVNSAPVCAYDWGSDTGSFASSDISAVPGATVSGVYTNATRTLQVKSRNPGTIGTWNVKGSSNNATHTPNTYCVSPSILKQGNKVTFAASLAATADMTSYDPIVIG